MLGFPEILTNARFYLELKLTGGDDTVDGTFMDCSGFQQTQTVVEISEVTPQLWGYSDRTNERVRGRIVHTKLPGNVTYSNLILRRGLSSSVTLWNWLRQIQQGGWSAERREGALVIYNQAAEEQFRFEFTGAWPVGYKISDLDVKSGDYNIEEMEIAVETLKRVLPSNDATGTGRS
jgi:phage tail-like protein